MWRELPFSWILTHDSRELELSLQFFINKGCGRTQEINTNTTMQKAKVTVAGLLVALAGFLGYTFAPELGSVETGQEYIATTTGAFNGNSSSYRLLKSRSGAVGQVTITGAAAGSIRLYNSSTTNSADFSEASSTVLLIAIPVSAAAGTYTFDATFDRGILLETSGTQPTSTITYR